MGHLKGCLFKALRSSLNLYNLSVRRGMELGSIKQENNLIKGMWALGLEMVGSHFVYPHSFVSSVLLNNIGKKLKK